MSLISPTSIILRADASMLSINFMSFKPSLFHQKKPIVCRSQKILFASADHYRSTGYRHAKLAYRGSQLKLIFSRSVYVGLLHRNADRAFGFSDEGSEVGFEVATSAAVVIVSDRSRPP
jgi:hypothetical protein